VAIITISRGTMSGGRAVAECLAGRLGYPSLAREILSIAAARLGASEEVLQTKFETTPGLWARLGREREKYVMAVRTALLDACLQGCLVYHGLAGQLLLRGLPGVLRVRLIAPLQMRVRGLMDAHHRMGRRAAEDFIHNVDQDRKRWVKLTYGEDVEDPSLYDLTVNLRTLAPESACATIAEAAGQPTYAVTDEVREALAAEARACHRRLDEMTAGRADRWP
jgi:cytidylate kinase